MMRRTDPNEQLTNNPRTEITDGATTSKEAIARLFYTTGDEYYRDIYSRAYGEPLADSMPPASTDAQQLYQLYTQVAKAEESAATEGTPRKVQRRYNPEKRRLPDSQDLLSRKPKKQREEPLGFVELPPEIRNAIYRYALRSDTAIKGNARIPTIGLLRTCKQIHKEASSILYGENTFRFKATIDYKTKPEIHLTDYPDTRKQAIWPPRFYHEYLQSLHIEIDFNGGEDYEFNPPPIFEEQIQAMRDAFDEPWNDLGKS
jgi:hypothetical protein